MTRKNGGREEFARQTAVEPRATRVSPEALRALPTSARPRVDARDIQVPEGYRVEPVLVGLSFPCGMGFAEDGTLYLAEGGTTWPTRPWMPSRLLSLDPAGNVTLVATEEEAGFRGVAVKDGALYATAKGGYHSRVVRYDLKTRERTVLFDKLPDGGWHEPGGPVFGPDGLMYFAQGSVAQQGIIEPSGWTVDIARHPRAHDVPGQDVVLTGDNVWSADPVIPYSDVVETGAFKPYAVPAKADEVVKGEL
jgi:glucose/arabinose dehydrogenase